MLSAFDLLCVSIPEIHRSVAMPARVPSSLGLLFAASLLATSDLSAQDAPGNGSSVLQSAEGNASAADAEVRALVDQLISPDFAVRNAARAALLKVDESGLTVLVEAAKTANGETQNQLTVIVEKLQGRLFDAPLRTFQANPTVENAAALPGWTRIKELVSSEESALFVFREMLEAEPSLFTTLRFNRSGLPPVLLERSSFTEELIRLDSQQFPIASVLALMMVGTEPGVRLTGVTQSNINVALNHPQFQQLVKNGIHSSAIAAITENWLLREHSVLDAELLYTMKLESPAGIELSRRVLKARRTGPVECWALLTLGKLNDTDSLTLIEGSLKSTGRFWPMRGQSVQNAMPGSNFPEDYHVQASDVALAVALHLRGESLMNAGLKAAPSEATLFQPHSLGFNSDEDRTQAINAYRSQHSTPNVQ